MHIIIAPNSFKGSLTAIEAANAIAAGIHAAQPGARLTTFPIADGGDGTADVLIRQLHAEKVALAAHDPLGRSIRAAIGWIESKRIAILAMSDTSGIRLLKGSELQPLRASSYGTGEAILSALDRGAKKILLGVGGSATVDGGAGLLQALGVEFVDRHGQKLQALPEDLQHLDRILIKGLDKRLADTEIIVLCDVQNELLGDEGAATVFGPQKGATTQGVKTLEKCLAVLDQKAWQATGKRMSAMKHGGAAGGVAAALSVFAGAKLVSGIDYLMDMLQFDTLLQDADMVLTGEGKLDLQTLGGKGPVGVAKRARQCNTPVIAFAGTIDDAAKDPLRKFFQKMICINPPGEPIETAIRNTAVNLQKAAQTFAETLS